VADQNCTAADGRLGKLGDSSDGGAISRANDARTTHGGGGDHRGKVKDCCRWVVDSGRWAVPAVSKRGWCGWRCGDGLDALRELVDGTWSGLGGRIREGGRDGRRAGSGSSAGRYWGARRSRVCDALEPEKSPAPGMESSPDPGETEKSGSN
jgi:hypothetical protein